MTITCPGCRADIATVEPAEVFHRDTEVGDQFIRIGWRGLALASGFVNHKRRHRSRLPWYVPGHPEGKIPIARPPFVVTCQCGREVVVDPTAEEMAEAEGYMTGDDIGD